MECVYYHIYKIHNTYMNHAFYCKAFYQRLILSMSASSIREPLELLLYIVFAFTMVPSLSLNAIGFFIFCCFFVVFDCLLLSSFLTHILDKKTKTKKNKKKQL